MITDPTQECEEVELNSVGRGKKKAIASMDEEGMVTIRVEDLSRPEDWTIILIDPAEFAAWIEGNLPFDARLPEKPQPKLERWMIAEEE